MLTQIYNGHILTPQGWINGGSVVLDGHTIVEVSKSARIMPDVDATVDADGDHVLPGGIDLHCHGGGGSDFMEGTREAFENAALTHLKHGTTAIYATLSSSTLPMMEAACQTCSDIMRDDPLTTIMGLHLEGPYFNPSRAGAQMPEIIRVPDRRSIPTSLRTTIACAVGMPLPNCRVPSPWVPIWSTRAW